MDDSKKKVKDASDPSLLLKLLEKNLPEKSDEEKKRFEERMKRLQEAFLKHKKRQEKS